MHFLILLPPLASPSMSPSPPVGLAYLASILKSSGTQTETLMSDVYGLDVDQTIALILEKKPDILACSVATPAFNNTVKIVTHVKQVLKNIQVIAGGPHATLFPEDMISNGTDIVVRREGEQTIAEVVGYFNGEIAIADIDGISYRLNNRIVHNQDRMPIKDLDQIPFPAWEVFPIQKYESVFKKARLSLPVVTSRGCPGKCTFCYKGIFGSRIRMRSPQNIIKEIIQLINNFNIEEFSIIDDCFTISAKRTIEFCDLLMDKNITIAWSLPAGIRVDTVSEELFNKLKESGCYRVGFGIETGNSVIMKSIKKGITLEQVTRAISMCKEIGLECTGNFMIGNLGETVDTLNDTIRYAIKLDPDYAQFTRAIPFPGSAMYKTLLAQNKIISNNWDDYDYLSTEKEIFIHDHLSHRTIQKMMKESYRKFYMRPAFIIREIRKHLSKEGLRKLLITIPFAIKRLFK
jgi:radical SAM superfamily enzyme YgiQ (UPF0313 family)